MMTNNYTEWTHSLSSLHLGCIIALQSYYAQTNTDNVDPNKITHT